MKQKAFTLIELLVVIGIIGILSAIGVVSFGAVREKARRGACIATLRSNFNSDENLVAYWNFDEQSPGTIAPTTAGAIKDFWGHNGTATVTGGYPIYQEGIIDSALEFNGNEVAGNNNYVNTAASNDFNLNNTKMVTLEIWLKPTTTAAGLDIALSKGLPYLGRNGQNAFFSININGVQRVIGGTINAMQINKWNHLVGTYNGISLKVYLNGIVDGTTDLFPGSIISNGSGYWIGRHAGCAAAECYRVAGLIDEPIIYNRTLSADEIASHYNACKK